MTSTVLYKKNCEPYTVHSQEELTFHLNQGWVKDPKLLEEDEPPAFKPVVAGPVLEPAADNAEIASLKEALAAKDKQLAEQEADFTEITDQLNKQITALKETIEAKDKQIVNMLTPPAGGGAPAGVSTPAPPKPPTGKK